MDLLLCSLVTTTGVINTTVLVESGTQQLGDTILSDYFNPRMFYEVKDANGSSHIYDMNDTVSYDINVIIIDQCSSLNKWRCRNTGDVCTWNKNRVCARGVMAQDISDLIICASVLGALAVISVTMTTVVTIVLKMRWENRRVQLAALALDTTAPTRRR